MARRSATAAQPPEGMRYAANFLDAEEERDLLALVETLPFHEVRMMGQVARRTVIHFGWDYDYDGWAIRPADPPPPRIRALADRAAAVAGVEPDVLEQFLVARYPPGATIGWHRDAPMFGTPVIGVSLLSPCAMRFRRKAGDGFETYARLLEPRSLYILDGDARTKWQHSIPPAKELRYSISMRTLRRRK